MRIAIGGIATESCTFSPLPTRLEDFTVLRAEALARRPDYSFLEGFQGEILPTLQARALPGGPVDATAYRQLKEEFLEHLRRALPLDGLYLDMHGAMNVVGMDDAEGDWIAAAREVVGARCLISASYDLHGNISARVIDNLDLITAYRTAPHIDVVETRTKAFALLLRCLEQGLRPERVWIPVPVALPGERTSTEHEPAASLYASLREIDPQPGVLDVSLLVGYVWADEPRAGASVVLTGTDTAVLKREAKRLARRYWGARAGFVFGVPAGSIDACLDLALGAPEHPVFVSDSGDNPHRRWRRRPQ